MKRILQSSGNMLDMQSLHFAWTRDFVLHIKELRLLPDNVVPSGCDLDFSSSPRTGIALRSKLVPSGMRNAA